MNASIVETRCFENSFCIAVSGETLLCYAAVTLAGLLLSSYYLHSPRRIGQVSSATLASTRAMLPGNLATWRNPGPSLKDEERIWQPLEQVCLRHGVSLWEDRRGLLKAPNNSYASSAGFSYAIPSRGLDGGAGGAKRLSRFQGTTPLTRIGRMRNGQDVVVKVVVVKQEGHEHYKIIQRLASGPLALLSTNHALPIVGEFCLEDVKFLLFPRVGGDMEEAFGYWADNSVGDTVDMLMQALEALAFIHDLKIAHRDAFCNNFLVQWHPESMRTMTAPICRPRVYLIDFEMAVEFPSELPHAECLRSGYPLGGSCSDVDDYARPLAPEITKEEPYSPFKLDVWQLGYRFNRCEYTTSIQDLDDIIAALVHPDWRKRTSASEALERMRLTVNALPPSSLLISPSHDS